MEKSQKNSKLNAKDLIFIGIFGTVALLIFFVTGAVAALTLFGTVANIPITLFFISIAFMLLVSRVRKTGSFFIMGTIVVLPGFMAANGIGVGLSIIGWLIAEIIATKMKYSDNNPLCSWFNIRSCFIYIANVYVAWRIFYSEKRNFTFNG